MSKDLNLSTPKLWFLKNGHVMTFDVIYVLGLK